MGADRLVRAGGILAVLTLTALIFATQLYVLYRSEGIRAPFAAILLLQFAHWYLWAAAGPLVWRVTQRWPVVGPHGWRNVLRHAGAAVVIAVLFIGGYVVVYQALLRVPGAADLFRGFSFPLAASVRFFLVSYFPLELLVYAGIVALAQASLSTAQWRAREHEALRLTSELATARLQTLRAQLQPHFLFNTLHTIGSLVLQRKNERAVGMIAELGDLLRETLDRRNADVIPLRDEIAHLDRYIRIEEARFGDRLAVTRTISPDAEGALVPSFILQPLVENAFRHGTSRKTETARLDIRATVDASRLIVEVYNDGPLLPPGWSLDATGGFGLRNVADRLAARDPGAQLSVENAGHTGVRATIVLPLVSS